MNRADAIILAGGLGTRLRETVPYLPKSLAPINGMAFLDLILDYIEQSRVVAKVILALGYKSEMIWKHCQTKKWTIPIEYSIEEIPLGTGGAVKKALGSVDSPLTFIFNGDSFLGCNLKEMIAHHRPSLTMAYTHVENASRYGTIEIGKNKRIVAFHEKRCVTEPGFINAGIYLCDRAVFNRPLPESFSLEKEFFPLLLEQGMHGFHCKAPFIDIGTKESYCLAQELLSSLTQQNHR